MNREQQERLVEAFDSEPDNADAPEPTLTVTAGLARAAAATGPQQEED